ncbi:MAG: hypothetical protein AB7P03_00185 [Kofleriaceae bacterium]
MKLAIGSLSLALVLALGVGCKKKEEAPTDKPAAGSAADPAAKPADPAAAKPADPAAPAAPMGDMTVDQACDKMVGMMTQFATVAQENKDNCDAMGAALEKLVAEHKPFVEWAKKQDEDPAKKKEFEDKCKAKSEETMKKLEPQMEGMSKCATNERVKAAMTSFMGG